MLWLKHRLSCRVARGADLLDRHEPGWHHHVDADALNLCSENDCILGQVGRSRYQIPRLPPGEPGGGGYTFMLNRLDLSQPVRHGFLTFGSKDRLERLWRQQIATRLALPHSDLGPATGAEDRPTQEPILVGAGSDR